MSIVTGSILVGATPSFTGGTSASLSSKGTTLTKHEALVGTGGSFALQPSCRFATQAPHSNPERDSGYSQQRSSIRLRRPMTTAGGTVDVETVNIDVATNVETTTAELAELLVQAAQLMVGSDFSDFWSRQSLA